MCRHQHQFRRDKHRQTTVLTIIFINFIPQRFGAGGSMNAATAASPVRYGQFLTLSKIE
jgi:hypothetical protein